MSLGQQQFGVWNRLVQITEFNIRFSRMVRISIPKQNVIVDVLNAGRQAITIPEVANYNPEQAEKSKQAGLAYVIWPDKNVLGGKRVENYTRQSTDTLKTAKNNILEPQLSPLDASKKRMVA